MAKLTLEEQIRKMLAAQDQGQAKYKKADELFDALLPELLKAGGKVALANGETAVLKDLFEEKNKIFVGRYARRYEIEITQSGETSEAKPKASKKRKAPKPSPSKDTISGDGTQNQTRES